LDLLQNLLQTRFTILRYPHPYPEMEGDLKRLMPPDFLQSTPFVRLYHLCRYLKAVLVRAERAHLDPRKDALRGDQVRPYQQALERLLGEDPSPSHRGHIQQLRWMLEEFRVSIFAQELGTAHPISSKRLDKKIDEIERLI
jgi:ATP-dependent helicase HrpA